MTTPELTSARRITVGSIDYVPAWLDSHGQATLSAQPVVIALTLHGKRIDGDTNWRPAEWAGSPGFARTARILIGPGTDNEIPKGDYDVWARVTDNPTAPEIPCGRLTVY